MARYQPVDRLFLWLLTDPAQPVWVGELNLARTQRGVSLRYADAWIERGFALSEDLPLVPGEFMPMEKDSAAGAVDDARPDRWGERVIRFIDKPPRLSLLEFLYFAGDDRFGALGVSTSQAQYEPRRMGPLPTLADAEAIHELVRKVLANEPIPSLQRRLISAGATMGGARPKAMLDIDGAQWIVKFSEGEPVDTPLIEHATMQLARTAGIRTAQTLPIRLVDGHAVAIQRFDRVGATRLHALSAHVALRAAAERIGYPELAQLRRRRGAVARDDNVPTHGVQHPDRQHRRPRKEPCAAGERRATLRAVTGVRRAAEQPGVGLSADACGRKRCGFDFGQRDVDVHSVRTAQGPGRERGTQGVPRRRWLAQAFQRQRRWPARHRLAC